MSPTAPLKRGSALPSTNPRHRQRPKKPRPQGPKAPWAPTAPHTTRHPQTTPYRGTTAARASAEATRGGIFFTNATSGTSGRRPRNARIRTLSRLSRRLCNPSRRSRDCDTQDWIPVVSGNASHYLSLLGSSRQSERDPTGGPAAFAGVEEPSSTLEMNLMNPNRQNPPGAQAVVCF